MTGPMTGPEDTSPAPPAGYKAMPGKDPFMIENGPIYRCKTEAGGFLYGFTAMPRHGNAIGVVNGGMLFSFADHFMGLTTAFAARRSTTTISMNVNFLAPGKVGDWIEGEVEITRMSRSLGFARARIFCRNRTLVTADGVFKLFGDTF